MKRFETLYLMKVELKKLVAQIKDEKKHPRAQHTRAMFEFRHLHVARCLIKGRTLEEIEGPKSIHKKSGNYLNETYLERLLLEWRPKHEAEQIAWRAATAEVAAQPA